MMIGRVGGGVSVVALLLASGGALAETKLTAVATANATYSNNPFGGAIASAQATSDRGSASVNASLAPNLSITSPTGSIELSGRVTRTEFFKNYSPTTDYSVNGGVRKRLSPFTSVAGYASFSSIVRSAYNPVRDPSSPEINPDDPIIVDPAAGASLAQRTNTLNAGVSADTKLGANDTLQFSARTAQVTFSDGRATALRNSDYTSYGGAIAYRRAIGEYSTIGLSGDVSRTTYDQSGLRNSTQYTPTLLFGTRLADRISLDLTAGVTIGQFEELTGDSSSTSFAGSANLCRIGDRSRFCVQGSRSVSPTTLSGASTVTQVGANYSYAVDPRSTFSASASYAKSRAIINVPGLVVGGINNDYGFASASYSYRLGANLSAVVTVLYSGSFNDTTGQNSNVSGTVGISYRLGEL